METREQLLRDASFLLKKPVTLPEDRRQFDAIMARIDEMAEYRIPPREQPGGGFSSVPRTEEVRNFEGFVRRGIPYAETRDMETGGAGAAFIPQAFYPVLTEAQKAWGQLTQAVTTRETNDGAPMKFAFSNDTQNLAHIVGETGPVSETDPLLSSVLLNSDQLVTDLIKISIAELQDAAFDLDKFVRDQFGKRFYRGLTQLITNGSSSGNIGSIISGAYNAVTSLAPNVIDYDDIATLYGSLDPAYVEGASWMMHSTTRALLLGVKDTLGRPLYVPSPTGDVFDKLLGRPVILNQYMDFVSASGESPSSDNIPIQFGDFKAGYVLRMVKPGLAIARLNERFMDMLEVGFLGYFRAGGLVTDAGTHPIVNLVMHS